MDEINSTDYHDFVIKNGKLIGGFDQMYKKSNQIPWYQDTQENWLDIRITVELLKEFAPFDYICDFGSGLGYLLDILHKSSGTPNCKLIGYDISQTCCNNAKIQFPKVFFQQLDLKKTENKKIVDNDQYNRRLFTIRGTPWFVFPSMTNVIKTIANFTKPHDLLLIAQNFPPLKSNFVGKEIIPSPEAVITHFNPFFIPVKTIYLEDRLSTGNDNWFIGVFKRRSNEE